jgi:hypothetical protein
MLDMHEQVENGRQELGEWFESEEIQEALARRSDSDPYVDPFGEGVTDHPQDSTDTEYNDDFFTKE